jgi:regulator of protease activity HflC (stomatin/prohibitin superfamily)
MTVSTPGTPAVDNVGQKMKAYEHFVKIQSDSALRHVAGLYAYDHTGTAAESDLTLRSGGEEVNDILETQINERLSISGIEVVEARINYLAYAPEIAAVMLRRQQADAIIAAREKIVEGAVGMVKMALKKLADEEVVDLDDDKKAAMVSNLMVVLCSEEGAQPVVNAGTLHQ